MVECSERLSDHIALENVIVGVSCRSKQELLAKLSGIAAQRVGIGASVICDALTKREDLGSTGIGSGVAVPHACVQGLGRSFCLIARLSRPVDFDAIDDMAIDLVVVVLSPPSEQRQRLNILSLLSRRLRDIDVRSALRSARTEEDIRKCLT
jgi:nitrogen PTS system EIIA component